MWREAYMYLPPSMLALQAAVCGLWSRNAIIKVVMKKKETVKRIIPNSELVSFRSMYIYIYILPVISQVRTLETHESEPSVAAGLAAAYRDAILAWATSGTMGSLMIRINHGAQRLGYTPAFYCFRAISRWRGWRIAIIIYSDSHERRQTNWSGVRIPAWRCVLSHEWAPLQNKRPLGFVVFRSAAFL
jgi:hypothetical protein